MTTVKNTVFLFITVFIAVFVAVTAQNLVLQACCSVPAGGSNCASFSQPEEMFGVACCGFMPMNQFESICCDNVTRSRRQGSGFVDRCCGNQTLAFDQTCCGGVVNNVPNGECCGTQAYSASNRNALCCNGSLNLNVPPGSVCCGSLPYDGGVRESCCNGQIYQKDLFDGCCYSTLSRAYQPYNTRTALCCDQPIERTGTTKCCYLRVGNGSFVPTSYDYTTNCCAYPFENITPMVGGVCVYTP